MTQDNAAITKAFVEEVWSKGNLAFLDDNCTEGFRPNMVPPHIPKTIDGFKQYVGMFRTAIPDMNVDADDVISGEDKAVVRWTAHGTHDGPLMGIEPTGKTVQFTGMTILRFEGNRIAEAWAEADQFGLMVQVGHAAPLGQAPSTG